FSAMKMRPSDANCTTVGLERPLKATDSVNPAGTASVVTSAWVCDSERNLRVDGGSAAIEALGARSPRMVTTSNAAVPHRRRRRGDAPDTSAERDMNPSEWKPSGGLELPPRMVRL